MKSFRHLALSAAETVENLFVLFDLYLEGGKKEKEEREEKEEEKVACLLRPRKPIELTWH